MTRTAVNYVVLKITDIYHLAQYGDISNMFVLQ